MIPAENYKQRRHRRRQKPKALLGKRIGVKQPPSEVFPADCVLSDLVDTIERGEIKIGRSVVLGPVFEIGTEEGVRDNRGEGECQRRVLAWMFLELEHSLLGQFLIIVHTMADHLRRVP